MTAVPAIYKIDYRYSPRFTVLIGGRDADPTRTLTLRRRWTAEMDRRFKSLRRAVVLAMREDRFNLHASPIPVTHQHNALPSPASIEGGRYTYRWSRDKAEEFMEWLEQQSTRHILTMEARLDLLGGRSEVPWTNTFIDTAYQSGIRAGRAELREAGEVIPDFGDLRLGVGGRDPVTVAFNQPLHADRAGLIYSRVFTDLKGVTAAMNTQMSRVLSLGIAEGRNPRDIARELAGRVDAIGITRARLIARTEVIRAHNEAKLNEFERVEGMTGDEVKVRWVTARDERVRATHRERHGKIYTRAEARQLIGEPNCRCTLVPVIPALEQGLREEAAAGVAKKPKSLFKNPEHQRAYESYLAEYSKISGGASEFRKVFNRDCDKIVKGLDAWQGSTQGTLPASLKYLAASLEKRRLKAFVRKDAVGEGLLEKAKGFYPVDQYLRARAISQAYMKQLKVKTVELYRGTDGGSGIQFAESVERRWYASSDPTEFYKGKFEIRENALVGYTSEFKIAKEFGTNSRGIAVRRRVKADDIFVHHDVWPKEGYVTEKEFILFGEEKTRVPFKDVLFTRNYTKEGVPIGDKWPTLKK